MKTAVLSFLLDSMQLLFRGRQENQRLLVFAAVSTHSIMYVNLWLFTFAVNVTCIGYAICKQGAVARMSEGDLTEILTRSQQDINELK